MCEIMTVAAAILLTAVYFAGRRQGKDMPAVFTTMLAFWGAALMWSVDCVANRLEGEAFFDMSREDAILGFIILAAGGLLFCVLSLKEKFFRT